MRFAVGDRVKIVYQSDSAPEAQGIIGVVGEVVEVDTWDVETPYNIRLERDSYLSLDDKTKRWCVWFNHKDCNAYVWCGSEELDFNGPPKTKEEKIIDKIHELNDRYKRYLASKGTNHGI